MKLWKDSPPSSLKEETPDFHQQPSNFRNSIIGFSSSPPYSKADTNLSKTIVPNDQGFVIGECKKLVMQGRYSKAFINLRRHLMEAPIQLHLQPDYYTQVVHISLKIIEKYLRKQNKKIALKVPPLLEVCYTNIALWEKFLTELQNQQSFKDSETSSGKNSPSESNKISIFKHSSTHTKSEERNLSSLKAQNIPSTIPPIDSEKNEKRKMSEDVKEKEKGIQKDGRGPTDFQEAYLRETQIGENADECIQVIIEQFHLHRELFLCFQLKIIYISYQFYKQINQQQKAFAFLDQGSTIIRNFLCNFLFISSAELSRIAMKIEVTKGNIHMEQLQKQEAMKFYESAFQMGKNCLEVWVKKIGSYNSEKEIPIRSEMRFEKSIKEFLAVLFAKAACEESLNNFVRAIQTSQLANWVSRSLLSTYPSLSKLSFQVYENIKKRHSQTLEEEGEIYRLLRTLFQEKVNLIELKETEIEVKREKQLHELDEYFYKKGNCKDLNDQLNVFSLKKQNVGLQIDCSMNQEQKGSLAQIELDSPPKKPLQQITSFTVFDYKNQYENKYPEIKGIEEVKPKKFINNSNNTLDISGYYQDQTTQMTANNSRGTSFYTQNQSKQPSFLFKIQQEKRSHSFSSQQYGQSQQNFNSNNGGLQQIQDTPHHNRFNSFSSSSGVSSRNMEFQQISCQPSSVNLKPNFLDIPQNQASPTSCLKSITNIIEINENNEKQITSSSNHLKGQQYSYQTLPQNESQRKIMRKSYQKLPVGSDLSRRSSFQFGSKATINLGSLSKNNSKKKNSSQPKDNLQLGDVVSDTFPEINTINMEEFAELKHKFKYLRESKKEQQQKNDIIYQFTKVPLEERKDLLDLDICMHNFIDQNLKCKTPTSSYPQVHHKIDQTIKRENNNNKAIQFAKSMVSFTQKKGNGKSQLNLLLNNLVSDIPNLQVELNKFRQDKTIGAMESDILKLKEQALENRKLFKLKINQSDGDINKSNAFKNRASLYSPKVQQNKLKILNVSQVVDSNQLTPPQLEDQNEKESSAKDEKIKFKNVESSDKKNNSSENDNSKNNKENSTTSLQQPQQQQSSLSNQGKNLLKESLSREEEDYFLDSEDIAILEKPNAKKFTEINLKQNVMVNEQEREQLQKQMRDLRFKGKKIGIHELIATLSQKDNLNSNAKQVQDLNINSVSQSSYYKDDSKQLSLHKINQSIENEEKTRKSPSGCSINPKYYSINQIFREHGELQTTFSKQAGTPPFEIESFSNLAASTKNLQQRRSNKQSNLLNLSTLSKVRRRDDSLGTVISKNSGDSSKHKKINSSAMNTMQKNLSLFFEQKKND